MATQWRTPFFATALISAADTTYAAEASPRATNIADAASCNQVSAPSRVMWIRCRPGLIASSWSESADAVGRDALADSRATATARQRVDTSLRR